MVQGLIDIPKLIVYGMSDLLTVKVLVLGLGLAPIGFIAAFLGKLILQRLSPRAFRIIIDVLLVFWGLVFLIKG